MSKIRQLYPNLSWDHIRDLALMIATERNAVAKINKVYKKAIWGIACLGCNAVKIKVKDAAESGAYPWLRYIPEIGMAYTVVVDDAPLRIQPESEEIREIMPGEREALRAVRATKETLFSIETLFPTDGEDRLVLRLEVSQRPAEDVDLITLYLFDGETGITLDREIAYEREGAYGREQGSANGSVISLARPAQDVDIGDLFQFDADNDQGEKDGSQ